MLKLQTRRNRWYVSGSILETDVDASGEWNPLEGVFPVTITVAGSFTGTVSVYVENGDTKPADADANHGVLQTFTAPGQYVLNGPIEWIKAAVSGLTGTVTVKVEASEAGSN